MRQRTDGAMARAGLSLGSNLEPEANLRSAIAELRARFGDVRLSRVYRTRAVGFDGGDFLNAAAVIETDLEPGALDAWLHALEDAHGRDRSGPRFGDRPLDIALVLYDERIVEGPGPLRDPAGELPPALLLRPLDDIVPSMVEPPSGLRCAEPWEASPARAAPL